MVSDIKKSLSLDIFRLKGVQFRESGYKFNLHKDHPDVPLSPNYVEMRRIFRNRQMRLRFAGLMLPIILDLNPDLLIDLPESVTPLVTTLSDMSGIQMISVRSNALKGEKKDHGIDEVINGNFEQGQAGLLIDDVVSSFAHTKFRAIPAVRGVGINLIQVICVAVDREEGGRERLAREGFELRSVLGLHSDITHYCLEEGLIPERIREMSIDYASAVKPIALSR